MVEGRERNILHLFTQALVALDEIVGCDGFEVGEIDGCLRTQGDDLRIELRTNSSRWIRPST